jgi:uncharacterized membrane protein
MSENLITLFQYLEKERITIDKSEFEFQIQSHPDYPSLLAVADTLSFFNIKNGVIQVSATEIDLLPDRFTVFLSKEKSNSELYLIERKDNIYFCIKDKKALAISKSELESQWGNIVLLIEKSETEEAIKQIKKPWYWVLQLFATSLFVLAFYQFEANLATKTFLIFPVLGILFSIAALKDLFGAKNKLLNDFCNMTGATNCNTVVGSTKWKIFEIVNFSDLSIVFFTSQFLGLFVSLITYDTIIYFSIQKILLLAAVPILLLSLYYQKFVEKKWCPICLVIITVILLELGFLFVFQKNVFVFSMSSIILFGLVFTSLIIVWSRLKKILTQLKELKESQLKGTRFMRNYEVFKNSLLASSKVNYQPLSSGNLVVGNENANLKITLISNPFCGHCAATHTLIEDILKVHKDSVCVDFRFNFSKESNDEQSEKIHQKLVRIYYDNGQEAFLEALRNWFENKNDSQLITTIKSSLSDLKINEILQEQYLMNQTNEIAFTPAIIINQYQYPKIYDRAELVYFINDLIEDEDFQ